MKIGSREDFAMQHRHDATRHDKNAA